jgi:hypothetical protein
MPGLLADLQFAALSALVAVIVFVIFVRYATRPRSRQKHYRSHDPNFRSTQTFNSFDVGQQLQAVMGARFQARRVMNAGEYHVFRIVEEEIFALKRGYRVFAQTSLGAVLESPNENAFRSINSKRVDALVVDKGGRPVLAVEYQGTGHFQGTAPARDAIKKEALRKAGVAYLEVLHSDDLALARLRVRELLVSTFPTSEDKPQRGTAAPTFAV